MANIFRIVSLVLICWSLQGCVSQTTNSTSVTTVSTETKKAQVVIIGSIHGSHYINAKYSPEILKEIIISSKPDVILNELPLNKVDPNGRPIHRDPNKNPEGWAADAAAIQLGIGQIPFDRPDRDIYYQKTQYFNRLNKANMLKNKWAEQLKKQSPGSLDFRIVQLREYASRVEQHFKEPEAINSEAFDSIIRIKHSIWQDIMPMLLEKQPEYQGLIEENNFLKDVWHERNRIMADNIIKTAKEFPGKRLVVVTGCYHRYILRDLLKVEKSIELKEFWEVEQ